MDDNDRTQHLEKRIVNLMLQQLNSIWGEKLTKEEEARQNIAQYVLPKSKSFLEA